jgi:hypothetical protein
MIRRTPNSGLGAGAQCQSHAQASTADFHTRASPFREGRRTTHRAEEPIFLSFDMRDSKCVPGINRCPIDSSCALSNNISSSRAHVRSENPD